MADRQILLDFEKPIVELENRIAQIRELANQNDVDMVEQISLLEQRAEVLRREIFSGLGAMQRMQIARHPRRPSTLDYVQAITDEWLELHGDRRGNDDPALVGGLARVGDRPVVILGHQKGRDTKDNMTRNFGMASPGGYRKASRLMDHADRFGLPIITLIDTPGAYPGVSAEEQGQGEAIAANLRQMFGLRVPIICTVIGEGGSGGALGIGIGDHIMMFENSVYTVATPEACAAILWRDSGKAGKAAEALKITAPDLKRLGIVDQIINEPLGGAHRQPLQTAESLKSALITNLDRLSQLSIAELKEQRYQKFRKMGVFLEM
ncbi:MAG: acetyl-CoA carboxylase carboxyltransferase subunit alpha [Pseudanabaenaceae cyanobacterium bins.39]|nr:acetyl-CoA carboxylase carboxyltransferase subunit alpha [Pseudanabaenaceae cyanobacterium bins.39]